MRTAISFGNDTDTTACIAGGLAGIKYELAEAGDTLNTKGIPREWVDKLIVPEASAHLLSDFKRRI